MPIGGVTEDEGAGLLPKEIFRDIISKSTAYKWLRATLCRELLLAPMDFDSMKPIRENILHFLPLSRKTLTRNRSPEASFLIFKISDYYE